jgi:chaperonin GroEL
VLVIKAPGYGDRKKELLEDIGVMIGATVVSEEKGIKLADADMAMLGSARKVVATKEKTIIVGGKGKKPAIDERIKQLRTQFANTQSKFDKEKIEERIAKLSGGVAVIKVGAATETEMKYLKLKIEDAVNATKAAIEEGIVPGGGSALAKVSAKLSEDMKKHESYQKAHESTEHNEFTAGYSIVVNSLLMPLKQIAMNAGKGDGSLIVGDVVKAEKNMGYDAKADEMVDMFKKGIIDPVKVTRSGLQNAASAASVLLTTEAAVAEEPKEEKDTPMMPPGGMGY